MLTSLLLTTAVLTHIAPVCSWDRPGHNPFQGNLADAVDHYKDIPRPIREVLKLRIRQQQPDETVHIGRDHIRGQHDYDPAIHDMHFGPSSMCRSITRSAWPSDHVEPAEVYCEQGECVIVPRICNNLSRIRGRAARRAEVLPLAAPAPGASIHPPLPAGLGTGSGQAQADPDQPDAEHTTLPGGSADSVLRWPAQPDWYPGAATCRPGTTGCADAEPIYAPVPEPANWAMWLAGLGLLAATTQRWRRSSQLK